jgi:ArsR family transcriptional regulator
VRGREAEMENRYTKMAKVFQALSDPKRVKIVDLLSCGEMCGCVLLKCFEITQPTLAHDMKVLTEAGITLSRREGKKTMYSLNWTELKRINGVIQKIISQEPAEKEKPEG